MATRDWARRHARKDHQHGNDCHSAAQHRGRPHLHRRRPDGCAQHRRSPRCGRRVRARGRRSLRNVPTSPPLVAAGDQRRGRPSRLLRLIGSAGGGVCAGSEPRRRSWSSAASTIRVSGASANASTSSPMAPIPAPPGESPTSTTAQAMCRSDSSDRRVRINRSRCRCPGRTRTQRSRCARSPLDRRLRPRRCGRRPP